MAITRTRSPWRTLNPAPKRTSWSDRFHRYHKTGRLDSFLEDPHQGDWPAIRSAAHASAKAAGRHYCSHCGSTRNLQVDHIWPASRLEGLMMMLAWLLRRWVFGVRILCVVCNKAKSNKIRWADMLGPRMRVRGTHVVGWVGVGFIAMGVAALVGSWGVRATTVRMMRRGALMVVVFGLVLVAQGL